MDWDWEALEHEYITTSISYRKLAEKHKAPLSTLMAKGSKEGWVALREQFKSETVAKIIEVESDKKAKRIERLLSVSDKILDAVDNAIDKFFAEEIVLDKGALKQLSGTVKDIKDIQRTELDIEEQQARIESLKRQAESEDDDGEIVVKITGRAKEYAK